MSTRLFTAVLAISAVASAFTSLPQHRSSSSNNAFALRRMGRQNAPLHMSASTFNDNDLPEEFQDKSSGDSLFDDTGLLDLPTKFATGDDLHMLRKRVMELRGDLVKSNPDSRKRLELQRAILKAQQMDAEFVYAVSMERMETAESRGRLTDAEEYREEAMEARASLPQFNLEGLWVGKYGEAGYEMINVTYDGDKLHAFKVTGDKNVPKGELSFVVDLSPTQKENFLDPVELGDVASHQWGAKFLTRFAGEGQVAGEGFVDSRFLEGQLILVNEFFSFAWLPIGHQVFFGRPSPELTLKLLRTSEEATTGSDTDKARVHLQRCMEETSHLEEELDQGIVSTQEDYYGASGYFE